MRYNNSTLLYDLSLLYKSILSRNTQEGKIVTRAQICKEISLCSAPRFYITLDYARRVINNFTRGINTVRGTRNKKHLELYRRYLALPPEKRSINDIKEIIDSPAPSFYLSPHRINHLLYKSLKL